MFRLYNMSKGISLIDMSEDENDIKETLGECMTTGDTIDYMIINSTRLQDDVVALIHNFEDYMNYVFPEEKLKKEKVKRKLPL